MRKLSELILAVVATNIVCILLNSCEPNWEVVSTPPVDCQWNENTYYGFDTYLSFPNTCISQTDAELLHPFVNFCDFFDNTSGRYSPEIVWCPIGLTCSDNTRNGPKNIFISTQHIIDCIGFEAYSENVVSGYTEYEITLKLENIEDQMNDRSGTLLWHRIYTSEDVMNGTSLLPLDLVGSFIPYDGDRRIYVHNTYQNF